MQKTSRKDVQDLQGQGANEGPLYIVRLFKYHRQDYIPSILNKLPIERMSVKTEYLDNKKYYDKLFDISKKYGLKAENYIKFCLKERGVREAKGLLDILNIQSYITYLKESEQLKGVYDNFNRTADRIADICIERNISPEDYISELVRNNTLAYEYYSGNISKHYIAGIQNFKELYERLDYLNKEELSIIYEATDQLRSTLQESFMKYGNYFVKPISYTTSIIKTKLQNKTNTQTLNKETKLCAN